MHEVTWDQTLESKLKKMTCDERASSGSDYVVFGFSELMELEIKNKDDIKKPMYHPLQTKIACGKIMCNDEYVCLLGPKNSPVKELDIKRGSPGTGCSGGDGSSGLCMGGGGGSGGDGKAVSSAPMPMALLSLALALIMA
ncbi:hypothetical protein GCK72_003202 [Caenorhabditis remanei]|uniref:Uncharacterized protein n=1 Tax=Caenorhabditis remanei TaxID=31234 RepID=A0A6A5HWS6_CAERE|nr:hypothetical protein GCK72_003202 [Caenorhabditis remanei]KAF1771376.1 hypothetical protein GCK72_003202 [Caenorhabditis remanei]